jgi:acetyl-CoA synthetase
MPDEYERLYRGFHWLVPREFNMAEACGRRWAVESSRVAVHFEYETGQTVSYTYAGLVSDACRLSNALAALGVARGDRVAIVLPQRPEVVVAHFAVHQMGAVSMPLSAQFGADALQFRLQDSGAVVAICDLRSAQSLLSARPRCPALAHLVVVGDPGDEDMAPAADVHAWSALLARSADRYAPAATEASDPALLLYTSGTTGTPKGALLPHAALIGNLPGFVASQNWFPRSGDVFWSPADWAWTGGLMDALLPTLYFGFPIVGCAGRFTPERALDLMKRHRVTNAFLFPTALKMMMRSEVWRDGVVRREGLRLRALMSAGEAVGGAVHQWAQATLQLAVNEMFGQTEMNYVVGNSSERWPVRPGSMGRPYPGHRVAVVDDDGRVLPAGQAGEIAVHRRDIHGQPDPVFFLGYWNRPEATRAKFTGDMSDSWCRTGDMALTDERGYLWYQGRADDVFKASGYRIGPGEIEDCLLNHPAVANAAIVPKPDAERGAAVKAYVVVSGNFRAQAGDALAEELQAHVRSRLAPYQCPREVEFVDVLPMTSTGKVQRRVLRDREAAKASGLAETQAGSADGPAEFS